MSIKSYVFALVMFIYCTAVSHDNAHANTLAVLTVLFSIIWSIVATYNGKDKFTMRHLGVAIGTAGSMLWVLSLIAYLGFGVQSVVLALNNGCIYQTYGVTAIYVLIISAIVLVWTGNYITKKPTMKG